MELFSGAYHRSERREERPKNRWGVGQMDTHTNRAVNYAPRAVHGAVGPRVHGRVQQRTVLKFHGKQKKGGGGRA